MKVTITPGPLSGTITPPASKSQAHRLIIAGALGLGESRITGLADSKDIAATISCMEALGASFRREGDVLTVRGAAPGTELPVLSCGESGSTLRFLIPVALALRGKGAFRGEGRLMERPQEPYFRLFREKGIAYSRRHDTLYIEGTLTPGTYRLPGNVSSQFITGLLYALPLLPGDSDIVLTTALESAGYVDMTLEALRRFGVRAEATEAGWHVPGNQRYTPAEAAVEADWSQGAFFLAARFLGSPVDLKGLRPGSLQGDRVILDYSRRLLQPGPVELDVSGCPDLVPALGAMAALRSGEETRIVGAARLRLKESDRLSSVTAALSALGAEISEEPAGLRIRGKETLPGGAAVDSWNDHRIAMMTAIAATRCEQPVTVLGAACVDKSYPAFWKDYAFLGGKLEVEE